MTNTHTIDTFVHDGVTIEIYSTETTIGWTATIGEKVHGSTIGVAPFLGLTHTASAILLICRSYEFIKQQAKQTIDAQKETNT